MRVIDPGHHYELDCLDQVGWAPPQSLRFVKRVGSKFPGNGEFSYAGTISQEVIRALIDRTLYVDAQIDQVNPMMAVVGSSGHAHNARAIEALRLALRSFEWRAAEERGDMEAARMIMFMARPELEPTCTGCGHILCRRAH